MQGNILHILAEQNALASEVLKKQYIDDDVRIRGLFDLGAVYLNKVRLRADAEVKKGDHLRVHKKPRRYLRPDDLRERILWQDENFVVIDKPSGVPCHATVDNGQENLIAWLSEIVGCEMRVTHRLDIPTSGCLVTAKTAAGVSRFNKVLLSGRIQKTYEALHQGEILSPELYTHWMDDGLWAPRTVHAEPGDKRLECRLRVLESRAWDQETSWCRMRLETGRTHQIRTQLGFMGRPILNDVMYGATALNPNEKISLAAVELTFQHPFTGEWVTFQTKNAVSKPPFLSFVAETNS